MALVAVPPAAPPVTPDSPAPALPDRGALAGRPRPVAGDVIALPERRPRAGLESTPPTDTRPRARSAAARRNDLPASAREPLASSPSPEELLLLERAERALRDQHPALATA